MPRLLLLLLAALLAGSLAGCPTPDDDDSADDDDAADDDDSGDDDDAGDDDDSATDGPDAAWRSQAIADCLAFGLPTPLILDVVPPDEPVDDGDPIPGYSATLEDGAGVVVAEAAIHEVAIDELGTVTLLPPAAGTYTARAWHEAADGEPVLLDELEVSWITPAGFAVTPWLDSHACDETLPRVDQHHRLVDMGHRLTMQLVDAGGEVLAGSGPLVAVLQLPQGSKVEEEAISAGAIRLEQSFAEPVTDAPQGWFSVELSDGVVVTSPELIPVDTADIDEDSGHGLQPTLEGDLVFDGLTMPDGAPVEVGFGLDLGTSFLHDSVPWITLVDVEIPDDADGWELRPGETTGTVTVRFCFGGLCADIELPWVFDPIWDE